MKTYTIKDLQKSILSVLLEVKRICDKYNFKYILYGGSCLGAVRHNGFIPWDDDADIAMPRKDYELFKEACAQGALSQDYYFQDYSLKKEPHYNSPWIRIRKNGTKCVIDYHEKDGFNHLGVFVDIFPIDTLDCDDIKTIKSKYSKFKWSNKCFANKISKNRKTVKSKILHFALIPFSANYLYKKRESNMKSAKFQRKGKKCLFDFCSCYAPKGAIFPVDLFDDLTTKMFEGIPFNIPKKYDEMLTIMYGNYMELPPKEKRVAHLPTTIEL